MTQFSQTPSFRPNCVGWTACGVATTAIRFGHASFQLVTNFIYLRLVPSGGRGDSGEWGRVNRGLPCVPRMRSPTTGSGTFCWQSDSSRVCFETESHCYTGHGWWTRKKIFFGRCLWIIKLRKVNTCCIFMSGMRKCCEKGVKERRRTKFQTFKTMR